MMFFEFEYYKTKNINYMNWYDISILRIRGNSTYFRRGSSILQKNDVLGIFPAFHLFWSCRIIRSAQMPILLCYSDYGLYRRHSDTDNFRCDANLKIVDLDIKSGTTGVVQYVLAGLATLVTAVFLINMYINVDWFQNPVPQVESTVKPIGILLMTEYFLAFQVAAILLLLAFIGAAKIARRK